MKNVNVTLQFLQERCAAHAGACLAVDCVFCIRTVYLSSHSGLTLRVWRQGRGIDAWDPRRGMSLTSIAILRASQKRSARAPRFSGNRKVGSFFYGTPAGFVSESATGWKSQGCRIVPRNVDQDQTQYGDFWLVVLISRGPSAPNWLCMRRVLASRAPSWLQYCSN